MTGWRVYPAVVAAVALAGCGGGSSAKAPASPASPRVLELGWVERSRETGLTFRVDRLIIRDDGWQLSATVTNSSASAYVIERPHRPRGSMFGLVLLKTATTKELRDLTADLRKAPPLLEPDRVEPPIPRVLGAGSRWRGTLTGSTPLPKRSVVRAMFGRFSRVVGHPRYVFWVTEHAVRI